MPVEPPSVELRDHAPDRDRFREDVVAGLRASPKCLPCKYFYDERGSALFERICRLDEYYLTRSELAIMEADAGEMAARLGPDCLLIEYGSGSSRKTRLLLEHLETPAGYVPVDISREILERSARDLASAHPRLEVLPVCADYTESFALPSPRRRPACRAVYFPGSTVGNFAPREARAFLARVATQVGGDGALLIGVDLKKDPRVLERAYADREGVTAAFNRNVLARINRELGAEIPLDRFEHRARYDAEHGRIEMYLVSRGAQTLAIDGEVFRFGAGEAICTEHSYKYDVDEFAGLAADAKFVLRKVWTDPERLFSVQYLTVG